MQFSEQLSGGGAIANRVAISSRLAISSYIAFSSYITFTSKPGANHARVPDNACQHSRIRRLIESSAGAAPGVFGARLKRSQRCHGGHAFGILLLFAKRLSVTHLAFLAGAAGADAFGAWCIFLGLNRLKQDEK